MGAEQREQDLPSVVLRLTSASNFFRVDLTFCWWQTSVASKSREVRKKYEMVLALITFKLDIPTLRLSLGLAKRALNFGSVSRKLVFPFCRVQTFDNLSVPIIFVFMLLLAFLLFELFHFRGRYRSRVLSNQLFLQL